MLYTSLEFLDASSVLLQDSLREMLHMSNLVVVLAILARQHWGYRTLALWILSSTNPEWWMLLHGKIAAAVQSKAIFL